MNLIAIREMIGQKINDIQTSLPDFSFFKVDLFAYAAGPGSYTGARLAYTFSAH